MFCVSVAGAGAAWDGGAAYPLSAAASPPTIAILGSSTAAGTGATKYDSAFAGRYAKYLAGLKPSWSLVNLAVGGYTTYHVMPTGYKPPQNRPAPDTARNITKVLSLHPQVLLICLPSNDINNGYAANEYNANFDSLNAWAGRAGIAVWITTPLPRSALDQAHRQMLLALRTRILSRYAPRAIDFYDSLGDANGNFYAAYNSGDGIHTNDRGHKLLFNRVVAANLTGVPTALAYGEGAGDRGGVSSGLPILSLDRGTGAMVLRRSGGIARDIQGRRIGY
jgi:lysophospholipase L1-like esterase